MHAFMTLYLSDEMFWTQIKQQYITHVKEMEKIRIGIFNFRVQ